MTVLAVLVLLIAPGLVAWRWVTTPATAATGNPDCTLGVATRDVTGRLDAARRLSTSVRHISQEIAEAARLGRWAC
jgi:hypothetical protein